jgi:hypothetical protein
MRLVNVEPTTTDAQLRAAVAAPGGLFQSNDDHAGMRWPGDGIYNNPVSDFLKTRDDNRMSKTLLDIMGAAADPRLPIFAQPTPADPTRYAGLQNGLSHAAGGAFFTTTSRLGAFLFPGATAYGTFGGSGAKAPSFLQTYAEVQFILAEAAQRGIAGLAPAAARGYYEAGVRASMRQWSEVSVAAGGPAISDAQIAAYLARPEVAYSADNVTAQRQIITQKWIHLFTDGGEAWADWRRTCWPAAIKPGPSATQPSVPRRYMYSPTESSVNKAQLDEAIARQGEDAFATRMYWDKAPTAAPTYQAGCGTR